MYLYDQLLKHAAAAASAAGTSVLKTRQMDMSSGTPMVYNDSTIALAYGFTDYFDEETFGKVNAMLGWQNGEGAVRMPVGTAKFGQSSQLATATPFIVTMGMAALMLRFFARARFNAKLWWDDLFAVLATMFIVASQLIFMRIVYLGRATLDTMLQTTREWQEQRVERITLGLKLFMAFEMLFIISSFFIKYSFLFLYKRISKETQYIKWYLRAAFLITTLTFIFCILSLFLTCTPLSDFWNIRNPNPQCEKKILLTYGSGISNIVTDAMVLAIPIPLLLQASLNKRQIRGVSILYVFGAFVIVASVLRFVTQLKNVSMVQTAGWSQVEVSLALILACAPMAAKLIGAPLYQHTGCPLAAMRRSNNFGRKYDFTSPFDKTLPTPPTVMTLIRAEPRHVSRLGTGPGSTDQVNNPPQEDGRARRLTQPKQKGVLVKEMKSPMYRKLKLGTSQGTNGQTVWEVQPLSATTVSETTYSFPTRSPTSSTAGSRPGGLAPPPGWMKENIKNRQAEAQRQEQTLVEDKAREEQEDVPLPVPKTESPEPKTYGETSSST